MDLQPRKTVVTPNDDRAWLGSTHGTDSTVSLTLDVAKFRASGQVTSDGFIPSGTPIVKNTGTGLYEPAIAFTPGDGTAGTWAQADVEYHLYERVQVHADSTHAAGAGLWHGVVTTAKLPQPSEVEEGVAAPAFDIAKGATHVLYR